MNENKKREVTIEDLNDFFNKIDKIDYQLDKLFLLELWDQYKKIHNLKD